MPYSNIYSVLLWDIRTYIVIEVRVKGPGYLPVGAEIECDTNHGRNGLSAFSPYSAPLLYLRNRRRNSTANPPSRLPRGGKERMRHTPYRSTISATYGSSATHYMATSARSLAMIQEWFAIRSAYQPAKMDTGILITPFGAALTENFSTSFHRNIKAHGIGRSTGRCMATISG